MNVFIKLLTIAFAVIIAVSLFTCIIAFPVMLLWNWLMPIIFGLPVITFWQALGVALLSSILFKSRDINKITQETRDLWGKL